VKCAPTKGAGLMCKILDRMVLVKVSIGGGQISKQDKAKTDQLRSSSGNRTYSVTTKLYPKGTFDSVTEPLKSFKAWLKTRAMASVGDGELLTPVGQVVAIRQKYAETLVEIGPAKTDIENRWPSIVADAVTMRNGDVQPDDYPTPPPLDEWFPLTLTWKPHPKESALASALGESESALAEDLRQEMAKEYAGYVDAARQDLMDRVKTALGGFGRKCQRLRTDFCECPNCHYQFAACMGTTCSRCQTQNCPVHEKEKKVYDSLFEDLAGLADQLGVLLPDDLVGTAKLYAVMEPVLKLTSDNLRDASPQKLEDFEDTARTVARDLASIIAETFV
jgi:hypothetical protein